MVNLEYLISGKLYKFTKEQFNFYYPTNFYDNETFILVDNQGRIEKIRIKIEDIFLVIKQDKSYMFPTRREYKFLILFKDKLLILFNDKICSIFIHEKDYHFQLLLEK